MSLSRAGKTIGGLVRGTLALSLMALGCAPEPVELPTVPSGLSESMVLLTTTDHASGALSVVDLDTNQAFPDVALAGSDARVQVHAGQVYLVNRFGNDRIDRLDPDDEWQVQARYPIEVAQGPSNPQEIVWSEDGRAYLAIYGGAEIPVYDLSADPSEAKLDSLSLSPIADADGRVEVSSALSAHGHLWFLAQRLNRDAGWVQAAPDLLLVVSPETDSLVGPGQEGLELPGQWARQLRRDPWNGALWFLNSGLSRVQGAGGGPPTDPADLEVVDLLSPSVLAEAGIDDPLQLQAYDFGPEETIYLAAYRPDYSELEILRLDSSTGELSPLLGGLSAIDRSLEVVGELILFADRTPGVSSLRAFAIQEEGLVEQERWLVGLPPAALHVAGP